MKDIYDIIKLILPIKTVGFFDIRFYTKNFRVAFFDSLEYHVLSVKHIRKRYIFFVSVPNINSNKIEVEKPNLNDDGYTEFEFEYSFLEDIKIMDKNQLILSYGRFYPDYLRGDLTELYDCLYDNLFSKGCIH